MRSSIFDFLKQTWFKHVMQTSAHDSDAVMDVISEVHQLASRLRNRVMNRHRSKFLLELCQTRFVKQHAEQILNFNGDIGIPIDLDWEKNYVDRTQHPISEADNVILTDTSIIEIKKNISICNSNEIIGEFLGPVIFSKNGSKIFVEKYNKLKKTHHGNFHNAISLSKAYLTDMIQELLNDNIKIEPILINGIWIEIDTTEDLAKAQKLFF